MTKPLKDTIDPRTRQMQGVGGLARDSEGKPLCRWCHDPVPKGRRTMCSEECVHEMRLRLEPGYARRKVLERDRGVCAVCGLDTARIESLLGALHRVAFDSYWVDENGRSGPGSWMSGGAQKIEHPAAAHRREQLDIALAILGMWSGHSVRTFACAWERPEKSLGLKHSLWQMDHINPVVEGGGQCGLDNLRTLCLRCHKNATAELASRRARARNPQLDLVR
jgi:5-methylcytosine-specific restriction protein A